VRFEDENVTTFRNLKGLAMKSWSLAKDTDMTKLDPTLKHIGLVLRRRLTDTPSTEMSRRIAEVMERLSRTGQGAAPNHDSSATLSSK
jgi:hypothetical protein